MSLWLGPPHSKMKMHDLPFPLAELPDDGTRCTRDRAGVLCGPELGTSAVVLTDLALKSYDNGRAYAWDAERREAVVASRRG